MLFWYGGALTAKRHFQTVFSVSRACRHEKQLFLNVPSLQKVKCHHSSLRGSIMISTVYIYTYDTCLSYQIIHHIEKLVGNVGSGCGGSVRTFSEGL